MAKNFLNLTGLTTFFNQLKFIFATEAEVAEVDSDTDTYVLNIDYEKDLAFDTSLIIGDNTSPTINVGQVGFMIIAES